MFLSKYSHSTLNGVPEYKQSLVVQIFKMNRGTKKENLVIIFSRNMSSCCVSKLFPRVTLPQSPAKAAA